MQVRKGKPPGSGRLARTGVELSREARVRLSWMDFYRRCPQRSPYLPSLRHQPPDFLSLAASL